MGGRLRTRSQNSPVISGERRSSSPGVRRAAAHSRTNGVKAEVKVRAKNGQVGGSAGKALAAKASNLSSVWTCILKERISNPLTPHSGVQ